MAMMNSKRLILTNDNRFWSNGKKFSQTFSFVFSAGALRSKCLQFGLHFFVHSFIDTVSSCSCSVAHKILEIALWLFVLLFNAHILLDLYRIPMGKYYFNFRERIHIFLPFSMLHGGITVRRALTEKMLTTACTQTIFLDWYLSLCWCLDNNSYCIPFGA